MKIKNNVEHINSRVKNKINLNDDFSPMNSHLFKRINHKINYLFKIKNNRNNYNKNMILIYYYSII